MDLDAAGEGEVVPVVVMELQAEMDRYRLIGLRSAELVMSLVGLREGVEDRGMIVLLRTVLAGFECGFRCVLVAVSGLKTSGVMYFGDEGDDGAERLVRVSFNMTETECRSYVCKSRWTKCR